ncbi:MAG: hypothetical protein EG823_05395 [Actinobacteria bacterium]|nr:hypothetical protein [Actinomycetota bacterium]
MSLRSRAREAEVPELVVEAPAAGNRGWTVMAAVFGGPWVLATLIGSVWYVGWGIPDGWFLRVLVWIAAMALMAAVHALALLSLWATAYSRIGTETLVIDSERITLTRRAGRVPISLHIRRGLVESATLLPLRAGRTSHPRIEVKSWRSALRFGAGYSAEQAGTCVEELNAFFLRKAAVLDAR